MEDAAVEKRIEDEVANAVEDPGYGKRTIELNYTCGNPEMVRGDMMSRIRFFGTIYSRSHFKCLVNAVYDSYKTKQNYSQLKGTPMARFVPNLLAFNSQLGGLLLLMSLLLVVLLFTKLTSSVHIGIIVNTLLNRC